MRYKKGLAAIATAVILLTLWPVSAFAAFEDYTDLAGHWAETDLEALYDAGAFEESPPLFNPGETITRGKFAKYLVLGWGLETYTGSEQFLTDVPSTNAYFEYVNSVYIRGIMVGSGEVFGVASNLTRQEAATVIIRAAGLEPQARARPSAEAQAVCMDAWTDAANISPWAVPYMAQAYLSNLFVGDAEGTLRPLDTMSKAEAATVVARVKVRTPLRDFGDAPDWPSYFTFPSLLVNDGARHQDFWTFCWLGEKADGEIDSRQINSDYFDDGFVRFIDVSAAAPSCQIEFEVSVAGRDATLWGEDDNVIYFNLLVDFDQDMKWDTDEWVVQNMVIDPDTWPAGQTMAVLKSPIFLAPTDPYNCWFRMTLTMGEKAPAGWVGKGQFVYGETEDYGPEEQKIVVLSDLEDLAGEWEDSRDQARQEVAASLSLIVPYVEDLIAEEQADDPVNVLIQKKENILELLYYAAQLAAYRGLSDDDVDRIFEGLWKRMAFVAEEEVKKFNFFLLRETLRLNFNIPDDCAEDILDILDKLADLIYEQEKGDPVEVLLEKKDAIIAALEDLIKALEAQGLVVPAASARTALAWMLWLKWIEQPVPPPPQPPPPPGGGQRPPWQPPDDEQPPDDDQPPEDGANLDETPPLPGVVTGVGAIHQVGADGTVRMKIHITSHGPKDVYDLEIYPGHQRSGQGTVPDPISGPDGWTSDTGTAGTGWYGKTPLVPCQPYYFEFADGASDPIIFIVTDENHEPIGSSASQRVYSGNIMVPPQTGTDFESSLKLGDPTYYEWSCDSFFDVFFSIEGLPTGGFQGPVLMVNPETLGGVYHMADGLSELSPGGYVPDAMDGVYESYAPLYEGGYYAVCDHTGGGYALLHVLDVGGNGLLAEACWNPGGTLMMVSPIPLP